MIIVVCGVLLYSVGGQARTTLQSAEGDLEGEEDGPDDGSGGERRGLLSGEMRALR
jgi:hypothetical protein